METEAPSPIGSTAGGLARQETNSVRALPPDVAAIALAIGMIARSSEMARQPAWLLINQLAEEETSHTGDRTQDPRSSTLYQLIRPALPCVTRHISWRMDRRLERSRSSKVTRQSAWVLMNHWPLQEKLPHGGSNPAPRVGLETDDPSTEPSCARGMHGECIQTGLRWGAWRSIIVSEWLACHFHDLEP